MARLVHIVANSRFMVESRTKRDDANFVSLGGRCAIDPLFPTEPGARGERKT